MPSNPPTPCSGSCEDMVRVTARLNEGDDRMSRIEALQKKNNQDTAEVLEILQLGRSFFKLAGYFGSFIKWATPIGAAAWSVYQLFKNGGKS